MDGKLCERCKIDDAVKSERYCSNCRKAVIKSLRTLHPLELPKPPKSEQYGRPARDPKSFNELSDLEQED